PYPPRCTPSLHDALPICDPRFTCFRRQRHGAICRFLHAGWGICISVNRVEEKKAPEHREPRPGESKLGIELHCLRICGDCMLVRSEEHTSELQSPDHLVC